MKPKRGRRSLGGRGVFFCTLLAMGFYVAFDQLNLDGSDLCGRLLWNAVAVNAPPTDVELVLPQDPPSPEGLGFAVLPSSLRFVPDPAKVMLRTALTTFNVGPNRIHFRPYARRGIASTTRTSPAGDPA